MSESVPALLSVADAEQLAELRLSAQVRDFIAGGSGAELTRSANRAALDDVYLVPRVMAGVSACDPAAALAGWQAALPVAVAPMAYQRMVHADGEVGLAAACAQAGIPYTAAMLASATVEEIAEAGACTWMQLYWLRDRGLMVELIRRAEAAGCRALVLTVDVPELGRRLRDLRNGFTFPAGIYPANLRGYGKAGEVRPGAPGLSAVAAHTAAIFDPSLTWPDVTWLAGQTSLPLMLKGILDARDAARAADLGVAGIVVSNHGGRQLDGAVPSITALPPIVEAVAGRCQVILDSGVRGGLDVIKAVALGADGALLGRPALWGLAAGGAAGAAVVLRLLAEEFRHAMALAGCPDLAAVRALRTVVRQPAGRLRGRA
ncbi:MAG TPA: alpha-hydroxy acid oxidase [Streptosporangiaceae bacterium]|nr:alpha-hydroxy acid oxidase [Streptosporangiaceae bacterium]